MELDAAEDTLVSVIDQFFNFVCYITKGIAFVVIFSFVFCIRGVYLSIHYTIILEACNHREQYSWTEKMKT